MFVLFNLLSHIMKKKKVIIDRFTKPNDKGQVYMIVSSIQIHYTIEMKVQHIIPLGDKVDPNSKNFPLTVGQEIELPESMLK